MGQHRTFALWRETQDSVCIVCRGCTTAFFKMIQSKGNRTTSTNEGLGQFPLFEVRCVFGVRYKIVQILEAEIVLGVL